MKTSLKRLRRKKKFFGRNPFQILNIYAVSEQ
mgnify:CR=1 FL=1